MFIALNILYVIAFIWMYWKLTQKPYEWFKDKHLPVPEWVSFALGLTGIFIPFTPLFIDGMLLGTAVYFLNELIYQKTKWSPLADSYVWLKAKVVKLYQGIQS